ncbi:FUSC family protein [Oceanisphaera profunda]|nr:FUSC family protein [Oceanisphaera profunda]
MWLHKLLRSNPAKWPTGRSIRMAIGVGTPLAVGILSGQMLFCLWVTLGVMMQSAGEGPGSYRSLFNRLLIVAPIGALGYFAGHLWALPYPLALAIGALLSFVAGILNSYGPAYSKGTLQALIGGTVAFGLAPDIHNVIPYWQVAALYLVGAAFYALLLGVEALIDRRRPQRQLLADYLMTLAQLASSCAKANDHSSRRLREQSRQAVIDQYEVLYTVLIDSRYAHSQSNQHHTAILQAGDGVFSAILAHHDASLLLANAHWLQQLSYAVRHKHALPSLPSNLAPNNRLVSRVNLLAASIELLDVTNAKTARSHDQRWNISALISTLWMNRYLKLSHLIVGPEVLKTAAKLSLCMTIAYSMKYWVQDDHWYWIPLTVALVMKPELGSVFVRAVLRIIGTAIGVLIGSAILILVPKGIGLLAILIALAACMPWAVLRSYALQSILLTPLVLILIDLTSPGMVNINYAGQRLIDTAIGGTIVLIFGYFIWSRSHERQLASSYQVAMQALADYLRGVCEPAATTLPSLRRDVYRQLSNLRSQLQKQLSEPPPASREATKWFPIIMAAERLADRVTIYADNWSTDDPLPQAGEVEALAQQMQSLMAGNVPLTAVLRPETVWQETVPDTEKPSQDDFLAEITSELMLLARLLHATTPRR